MRKFLFILFAIFLLGGSKTTQGRETSSKIFKVHFIPVGYGDAIFIEFPSMTTMLIDAGGKDHQGKLLQFLKLNNATKIDTVLITHPHQNHFEGLFAILREIPIGRVFTNGDTNVEEGYMELLRAFRSQGIPVQILRTGSKITNLPKGVTLRILNPSRLDASPNDNSLVIWLKYHNISFLFSADIGIEKQVELSKKNKYLKDTHVVQIPHHGGPFTAEFIHAFKNPIFVVSTGENKWGLPSEEDLGKIKGVVLRTDRDGTLVFESDGQALKFTTLKNP